MKPTKYNHHRTKKHLMLKCGLGNRICHHIFILKKVVKMNMHKLPPKFGTLLIKDVTRMSWPGWVGLSRKSRLYSSAAGSGVISLHGIIFFWTSVPSFLDSSSWARGAPVKRKIYAQVFFKNIFV